MNVSHENKGYATVTHSVRRHHHHHHHRRRRRRRRRHCSSYIT